MSPQQEYVEILKEEITRYSYFVGFINRTYMQNSC